MSPVKVAVQTILLSHLHQAYLILKWQPEIGHFMLKIQLVQIRVISMVGHLHLALLVR